MLNMSSVCRKFAQINMCKAITTIGWTEQAVASVCVYEMTIMPCVMCMPHGKLFYDRYAFWGKTNRHNLMHTPEYYVLYRAKQALKQNTNWD